MNSPLVVAEAGAEERIAAALAQLAGLETDFEPTPLWIGQPLHTVYIPADRLEPDIVRQWGDAAAQAAREAGGLVAIAHAMGVESGNSTTLSARVAQKLAEQPIEDLRVDFEDGYGYRSDEEEDAAALRAGEVLAAILAGPLAPDRVGLRVKPLDRRGAQRGSRTLRLFLRSFLAASGPSAEMSRVRVTLAKVMNQSQVRVLDEVCLAIESEHDLVPGALGVELQVEVPHVIGGVTPEDALVTLSRHPRVRALHFGTYDYTSAQGILPSQQRSTHPVARHATRVMQVAAAINVIEVCDGSLNRLPVGDAEQRIAAWNAHAEMVRDGLQTGLPQGWDLHPAQLITRYLAAFDVLRAEAPDAQRRLRAALGLGHDAAAGAVLDEPATLRMLGALLARAIRRGALAADELAPGLSLELVERVARTGRAD